MNRRLQTDQSALQYSQFIKKLPLTSMKRGIFIMVMGPSGVGKGTIIEKLKASYPEIVFPVSATTRPMRPGEKEGDVYHFLTNEQFDQKIEDDAFLEWAVVHKDYRYGTLKESIMNGLEKGEAVLRELDVQGYESIRHKLPRSEYISIFIAPPSFEALQKRILERGEMATETLEKRLNSAKKELSIADDCDYKVINEEGKVDQAVAKIQSIIQTALKEKNKTT